MGRREPSDAAVPARPPAVGPAPKALEAPASDRVRLEPLVVPQAAVVAALEALAAAGDAPAVAEAALSPLAALPGVRAGVVVAAERARRAAVVIASSGYDCGVMAVGAELPLESGLPVTEAVRTARPVVRGNGPSWVAVPVGTTRPRGALLLSLDASPPDPAGLESLRRVASALGAALDRAHVARRRLDDLTVLEADLAAGSLTSGPASVAVRTRALVGALSGDVVAVVPVDGATWAVVADVAGRGAPAAVRAHALRSAARASAPLAGAPADLLRALDRALPVSDEAFATALVVRLDADGTACVASAGHPAPLVLRESGRVDGPILRSAAPLGCGLLGDVAEAALALGRDDLLLAWTDGLVDRRPEVDLRRVLAHVGAVLGASSSRATPEDLVEAVLAACDAAGPAEDDLSALALSLCRVRAPV